MKKIISAFGAIGLVTATAATSATLFDKNEVAKSQNDNLVKYFDQIVKTMSKEITDDNESFIKDIILNSISIENNSLVFNFENLNKISNNTIATLLNNEMFEVILQNMFDQGLLVIDKNNIISFKETMNITRTDGLWIEAKWYWFGYVQPHLNHELVLKWTAMMHASDGLNVIGNIISLVPEFVTVAPTLGPFLILMGDEGKDYFKSYDKGNGMGFGTYAMLGFVPGSFFSD